MTEHKLSRRDFVTAGGTAVVGAALAEPEWSFLRQRPAPINQQVQVGRVFVKSVTFTAKIQKVSIHKFQQKCTLQLGDPDNRVFGIYFHADVVLDLLPNTKGKADFGTLGTIQNVNFLYKRTPLLQTAKGHKFECASTNGNWELDGQIPYLGKSTNCSLGLNVMTRPDSPGVFLEEGAVVFEDVQADCKFRTYLIWTVGRAQHVLARIDWSWKGRATATGAPRGACVSSVLQKGWALTPKSADQQASAAIIGAAANTPALVIAPAADATKWDLC